jgi:hypothetical protein
MARRLVSESPPSDVPPETTDPLRPYRDAIASVALADEELTRLRSLESSLQRDADGVASAREKVLADSVSGGDDDGAVEELSRLRSRSELFERKIGVLTTQIERAEAEASQEFFRVKSDLQALWRSWCMGFMFGKALERADEFLIPGCSLGFREQCARMSKVYRDAFVLEPTADTAEGLAQGAQRLFEAVKASGWSDVPLPASKVPVAAPVVDPDEPPCMPRGDLGINIGEEFARYEQEDPAMTQPLAMKRLFREHPEIFVPLASDFEFEQQSRWPAGMIGSTVPDEPVVAR